MTIKAGSYGISRSQDHARLDIRAWLSKRSAEVRARGNILVDAGGKLGFVEIPGHYEACTNHERAIVARKIATAPKAKPSPGRASLQSQLDGTAHVAGGVAKFFGSFILGLTRRT